MEIFTLARDQEILGTFTEKSVFHALLNGDLLDTDIWHTESTGEWTTVDPSLIDYIFQDKRLYLSSLGAISGPFSFEEICSEIENNNSTEDMLFTWDGFDTWIDVSIFFVNSHYHLTDNDSDNPEKLDESSDTPPVLGHNTFISDTPLLEPVELPVYSHSPVYSEEEVGSYRDLISNWSNRIPYNPFPNFGNSISISSATFFPIYRTSFRTQFESRTIKESPVEPYNKQPYPDNPLSEIEIDIWSYDFGEPDTFTNNTNEYILEETRSVFECETCDAIGICTCSQCQGDGQRECADCDGNGYINCSCDNGEVKCGECASVTGGVLRFLDNGNLPACRGGRCKHCSGDGRIRYERNRICNYCGGSGLCRFCRGQGTKTCRQCSGDGRLRCKECKTRGIIICDNCKGKGEHVCTSCEGKKYLTKFLYIIREWYFQSSESLFTDNVKNPSRLLTNSDSFVRIDDSFCKDTFHPDHFAPTPNFPEISNWFKMAIVESTSKIVPDSSVIIKFQSAQTHSFNFVEIAYPFDHKELTGNYFFWINPAAKTIHTDDDPISKYNRFGIGKYKALGNLVLHPFTRESWERAYGGKWLGTTEELSAKSPNVVIFFLCIGVFGFHYFYLGKYLDGILKWMTFNFLGIGWISDIIRYNLNCLRDSKGMFVTKSDHKTLPPSYEPNTETLPPIIPQNDIPPPIR